MKTILLCLAMSAAACTSNDPPTASSSPPATSSPSASAAAAACTSEAMLSVFKATYDKPGLTIVSVDVTNCQNGYARALAVPKETNQEHEQVFLRDSGGTWVIVTSGTGIACTDANRTADFVAACVALGLS